MRKSSSQTRKLGHKREFQWKEKKKLIPYKCLLIQRASTNIQINDHHDSKNYLHKSKLYHFNYSVFSSIEILN